MSNAKRKEPATKSNQPSSTKANHLIVESDARAGVCVGPGGVESRATKTQCEKMGSPWKWVDKK